MAARWSDPKWAKSMDYAQATLTEALGAQEAAFRRWWIDRYAF